MSGGVGFVDYEKFRISITVDANDAEATIKRLSNFMAKFTQAVGEADPRVQSLQRAIARLTGNSAAASFDKMATATERWNKTLESAQRNAANLQSPNTATLAKNQKNIYDDYLRVQRNFDRDRNEAYAENARRAREAEDAQSRLTRSLATTRYALYDVSNAVAIFSAALIALPILAARVGIAWERDFANVVRTSSASTGSEIDALRRQFVNLAQELPVLFTDLTKIGTLGGQLGISTAGLENFTRVVAQLTATTDLTVDSAATALGRFKSLLGVPERLFDELASSILKVGVNSVATESQIVAISTQISSMGDFAGLSAQDVVGLAGALASVGAQPELSRGTITRTFTLISRAVAGAGSELDKFASLSGRSAQQFSQAWGTEAFGDVLIDLLAGIRSQGSNAVAVLNDLGITSVRDVPLLLRLANAADQAGKAGALLSESIGNARSGWSDNTELQRQFGIIAETTASKLVVLQNNFEAFIATLGEQGLGPIKLFVDLITVLLQRLTELVDNPVAQWIAAVGAGFTILLGIFGLGVAIALRATASILALTTALQNFGFQSGLTGVSYSGMLTALAATGPVGATAVRSIALVTAALKALGVITGALLLPEFTKFFSGLAESRYGFEDVNTAVGGLISNVDQLNSLLSKSQTDIDFLQIGDNIFGAWGEFRIALNAVDDEFANLIRGGNVDEFQSRMESLQAVTGKSFNELLRAFPDAKAALAEVASGSGVTSAALLSQADAEAEAARQAENLATQLGLVPEELENLKKNLVTGSSGFVDFGDLIQRVQDQTRGFAEKQSRETYGAIDSWQEFYDGTSVNIYAFMDLLDQQIAAQGSWADDLYELTARGATAFVSELAKMGPEGAPLAAAAVNLTAEELFKLEDQAKLAAFLASSAFANTFTENTPLLIAAYNTGGIEAVQAMIVALRTGNDEIAKVMAEYGIVSSENPIPIYATTTEADNELTQFLNRVAASSATVTVRGRFDPRDWTPPSVPGNNPTTWTPPAFASGGRVRGPGTATSDSIPARLSNGEYVIRANSVRRYGVGFMDALNRGVARFASGGPVGRPSAASASSGMGIVELGPRSLSAVREISRQQVYAVLAESPTAMADYVDRGSKRNAKMGKK